MGFTNCDGTGLKLPGPVGCQINGGDDIGFIGGTSGWIYGLGGCVYGYGYGYGYCGCAVCGWIYGNGGG